jgi:hypothetical protein
MTEVNQAQPRRDDLQVLANQVQELRQQVNTLAGITSFLLEGAAGSFGDKNLLADYRKALRDMQNKLGERSL